MLAVLLQMKIYVSGRIKDYPDYLEHFQRGCEYVRSLGHEPVNPCEINHSENATYGDFMREDIRALLDCEGIYMLEHWEKSVGARGEHLVAALCDMEFFYETHKLLGRNNAT